MAKQPAPQNKSHPAQRPFEDFMHLLSPGPRVDVTQRDDVLVIQADVPGMTLDDLTIEMHDDVLVLSGARKAGPDHRDGKVWRSERTFGSFSRVIHLPRVIDVETVEVLVQDGVLEITGRVKQ